MTSPTLGSDSPPEVIRRSRPSTSRIIAWLLLAGWATVAVTWLLAPAPADWSDF